jgi:hypothetical protein
MTLYNIYLPPYVTNVNDVRLKYFENKRYTMKDISQIDKRLTAVEYYTSLNNIENRALGDLTQYEDGTNKEKYGIIGENFKNYNIADYKNSDFTVNLKENMLTPYSMSKPHDLSVVSLSTATENEKTITLSYTETPAISQNVTSNQTLSVQPFLFAQFIGTTKMTPEIDYWASEELRPEVIRGPEVTTIIKEITNSVVIHETVIEKQIITTVPTPSTNSDSVIIVVPGTNPNPPPAAQTVPVIIIDPPPVIPPNPVEPPPVSPQPYLPMPPIYNWNEWGGYTGYDPYLIQYSGLGWLGSSSWVPTVDLAAVPYNAGQTLVTPLPSTPAQVYDTPLSATPVTDNNYYDMMAYYYY